MGCDIHLYVEKKKDGAWQPVTGINEQKCKYYRDRIKESEGEAENVKQYLAERLAKEETASHSFLYDGRNYALFSILANVRNHPEWGRARKRGYEPICYPKGLPDDVSDFVYGEADEFGCDGHSHSYLTVSELNNYDWNRTSVVCGYVDMEQYLAFKNNGSPARYCGDAGGRMVEKVTNEQMDGLIADPSLVNKDISYYTKICWNEPYKDSAGMFYDWSLPKLNELAGDDPDSVRIVFWFDN